MESREELRQRLDDIMNNPQTAHRHEMQMRELASIQAKVLLQVLDTLDRIDANQLKISESQDKIAKINEETIKTLERINKTQVDQGVTSDNLGKINNRIQKWMLALTVIILFLTTISLYTVFRPQPMPKPTVNNYYQYLYQCTTDPKQVTAKIDLCPTNTTTQ